MEKIAEPYEEKYWRLKVTYQQEIFDKTDLLSLSSQSDLPAWLVTDEEEIEHDEIIYRLALIGNKIGYKSYVGRSERAKGDYADRLSELSLTGLPKGLKLSSYSRKKVEQIDLIWFDEEGFPAYAYEIESTTSITSGIERFIELLKCSLQVAGKLILVCPASRRRKIDEVLSKSSFIGAPQYMENKLKYLFYQDIIDIYQSGEKLPLSRESMAIEIRKHLRSAMWEG